MDVEILHPLKLCLDTLNFLGLKFHNQNRWKNLAGILVHILIVYTFVFGELNHMTKAESLEEIVQAFSIFSSGSCLILKTIHYMKFSKSIGLLYTTLSDVLKLSLHHEMEDRKKIKDEIEKIVKIFKLFMFSSFLSVSIFFLTFFVQGLVYDVAYPFETDNWIGFGIAVVHQSFTCIYIVIIVICMDSLPVLFIGYATGITNELAKRLESTGSLSDENEELEKCIEIHRKMKGYVFKIQNNFSGILFIQGFISSMTICSNIFLASMGEKKSSFLRGLTFCVSLSVENLTYCYFGQKLVNSAEEVGNAIFHSEWYKMKLKTQKNLMIFMENLKNPLRISIFGVYEVNLMMFKKIIDISYSMYTVLRSMKRFEI